MKKIKTVKKTATKKKITLGYNKTIPENERILGGSRKHLNKKTNKS